MAQNDILPWRSPTGGEERLAFPVAANATFLGGEPVALAAAGTLDESADDPAAIIGIAAHRSTDVDTVSFPAGTMCTVTGIPDTQVFRCDNFATDGAGTAAIPTQANAIQELAGLTLAGGVWSIDTGTANLLVRIDDVLDANRNSITHPTILTGAGQTVLFRFI